MNEKIYRALGLLYAAIEKLGLILPLAAWMSVFIAAIALAVILSRLPMKKVWGCSLVVGLASLSAHLSDYFVTLRVSPDLADEINPIWRIVIDRFGVPLARVYGLTGKILLAVLSFELFAYYLVQREELFPEKKCGFFEFWGGFGSRKGSNHTVRWHNLANFFSFSFALIGPFFFYVAYLNSLVDSVLYYHLPSAPLALGVYLTVVLLAYFWVTYRAFRSKLKRPPYFSAG